MAGGDDDNAGYSALGNSKPSDRGYASQLRLLLWKNQLIKRRKAFSTCCEILLPIIFMSVLVLGRHFSDSKKHNDEFFSPVPLPLTSFVSWCEDLGPNKHCNNNTIPQLAIVAENLPSSEPARLFAFLKSQVPSQTFMSLQARMFATEEDLVKYVTNPKYGDNDDRLIGLAIVFQKWNVSSEFEYSIRVKDGDTPPTTNVFNPFQVGPGNATWKLYMTGGSNGRGGSGAGFVDFQNAVDEYILYRVGLPTVPSVAEVMEHSALLAARAAGRASAASSPFLQWVDATLPITTVMPFPVPHFVDDQFQNTIKNVLPFILMLAFMYPFSRLVRGLVEEKESRVKEAMKVMGLRDSVFWSSWGVTYFVIFGITAVGNTVLTTFNVFKYTSTGVLLLYFLAFGVSMITFACMVSTFFSKAKLAGSLSMFLFFGTFMPYEAVKQSSRPSWARFVAGLLSPTAFGLGSLNLGVYEGAQKGITFANWTEKVNGVSFFDVFLLMVVDAVLYAILTWYFDKTLPSEYGTRMAPWFCCTRKYWAPEPVGSSLHDFNELRAPGDKRRDDDVSSSGRPTRASSRRSRGSSYAPSVAKHHAYSKVEDVAPELMQELWDGHGVCVRGLTKEFDSADGSTLAVDHLNLDMFYGQVFALLGHNGAGKTTTISMLIGMLEPTAGSAWVDGLSFTTDMQQIREQLGFCPQHSILFPSLSVREHLEFFAYLKGTPEDRIPELVDSQIERVGLADKAGTSAVALSGGMQRKLSVAIALIGDSKIVFLDEPTSGMDPYSRRATWELIKSAQKDRVIVLTTHFMDEADVLADRIAIMSHGRLQACGSSMFLKSCYGVGYTLTLSTTEDCDAQVVANLISDSLGPAIAQARETTARVELLSHVGTELSFRVPFAAAKAFPDLFDTFDARKTELGVVEYGVSVTTLEEVFIRVAHEAEHGGQQEAIPEEDEKEPLKSGDALAPPRTYGSLDAGSGASTPQSTVTKNQHMSIPLLDRLQEQKIDMAKRGNRGALMWHHFKALFMKRFRYAKRDRKALVFQLLIPIAALVLGLSVLQIPTQHPVPLTFGTSDFDKPLFVPYGGVPGSVANEIAGGGVNPVPLPSSVTDPSALSHYLFDQTWGSGAAHSMYNTTLIGAFFQGTVRFDNETFTSLIVGFNTSATHSMPTFVNLGHVAVLRALSSNPKANIITTNSPFPQTGRQKKVTAAGDGIIVSLMTIIAFSFIPASYAAFVVRERATKAKHQQLVSGVDVNSYWIATYVWDICNYLVPGVASALIILAFQSPSFVGENYPATMAAFFLYGTSVISFTYCMSFLFSNPGAAQNMLLILYFASGLVLSILSFILSSLDSTKSVNKSLKFIYRLVPNFCLGDALFSLSIRQFSTFFGHPVGPFALEVTGYDLIFMAAESVVYFIVTIMLEHFTNNPNCIRLWCRDPHVDEPQEEEDEDVRSERLQITNNARDDRPIVLQGLRKVYPGEMGRPPTVAVRDLWFSIPEGQCFGFLGINGAGKTTTLGMLTGEFPPTDGTAVLGGYDIHKDQVHIRHLIGFCPQFDPLFDLLTGREHLELYARIKGVRTSSIPAVVANMLEQLTLTEYADRPAGTYSGGNKRKLSVANALIGSPKLVFLDEPSTGMDPVSRRFMWDFISRTMQGRSVILTTHSMEECEALCQRIGIMVSGRLVCLGTAQHLKAKFGQGYQLDIKLKTAKTPQQSMEYAAAAHKFMSEEFVGATLLESQPGSLKFKLPPQKMPLSGLFRTIEANKQRAYIQEYSVSQTTLEQVFIHFAKQQQLREAQMEAYARAHANAVAMGHQPPPPPHAMAPGQPAGLPPPGHFAAPPQAYQGAPPSQGTAKPSQ